MDITEKQLKGAPKKIGTLDGNPVLQIETKGGLFVVMTKSSAGKPRTLGTGSHPAVAQHIAERDNPAIKLTELSKSEALDPYTLRREATKYVPLTRKLQSLE
jgi:hypothetical protein